MRILYLTEFVSSIGGGGETAFYDIARQMAKKGHNVELICHQTIPQDSNNQEIDAEAPMNIHRIRPSTRLSHGYFPSIFQQVVYIANLVIKGAEVIRKNHIEIIHANTLSPAFAGSFLGKLFGVPVVNTIHHVYSLKNKERISMTNQRRRILWQQLLSLPKLICEKIIVRLPSDGIHTVSNSSKEDLIKFGIKDSSKITMIPNGIDIDCAAFNTTQCRYHNFALFIGRLVEYKNLGVAITAFGKVVEAMPDAGLVIVGDGPARHDLERSVISHHLSRNVEFTGYVSEEQKSLLLKNCSMLVFPSLIEGFGLVILEAFANRKPVLASDVKPLREIIKDGSDGFLVPPSESAKWADRILFCLKNKDICQSMGENGRRKAETNYNICKVAEDVESMYVKIIAARRRTDGAESIQKEGHGIATGIN